MNNPLYPAATRRASALAAGAAVIATLFSFGCQSPPPPPQDTMIPLREVILSPGDTMKVTLPGASDLNQSQKIRADGKINLPQIGEVKAAGKTLPQLEGELKRLYQPLLKNNDVLVTLESGQTRIYMSGAISKPGKLSFDRPTTILQAIAEAGGVGTFGSLKKVRILRLENGRQRVLVLDLRKAIKGAVPAAFYVRDGDIITIPASSF
jgi:protein involved in polysaccharide export with SLBB domain